MSEDHWEALIRQNVIRPPAGPRPRLMSIYRLSEATRLRRAQEAAERLRAEEQDRREWIEGVRRRLGLVAEVHRCYVYDDDEGDGWAWACRRWGCRQCGHGYRSQQAALAKALAHARAFVPEPPEDPPVTELDLLAFDALWAGMRADQDAYAAALPGRMEAVAERINGILPDGLRFEWVADE